VHVLRHGEVFNPEKVLYGRLPGYRLSERGERQAQVIAEHLAGADLAAVVASPLQRAQQTATPTAQKHGLEIVTDEGLIEAGNKFEGLKVAVGDGALSKPQYWKWMLNPFTPSWGEPYVEIGQRMLAAVQRARALAEGHEALCVSHQLPIWTLRRYVEGQRLWHDPRRRQCGLASLTSFVFEGEQVTQIRYTEPAGASDPRVTGA
jgi:broad specificity phosphatase PhoE